MNFYNISVKKINGETIKLEEYKNKIVVVVNTATKCGLAPQFEDLEKLYQNYKEKGLVVLGFPCSQFANQEESDNSKINEVCKLNFGVTFPLFAKIDVNGKNEAELFKYLKKETKSLFTSSIKWNFTKFLIDQKGNVLKRYSPTTKVSVIEEDIKKLLTDK